MSSTGHVLRGAALCIWGLLAGAEPSTSPGVVDTEPPASARAVDPGLTEVRITFDREMLTDRFSFMVGDGRFPETTDRPRWIDPRTCMMPVRLRPGIAYYVGINTGGATGFQAADGTPAEPFELRFQTTGERDPTEENRAATGTLRRLIEERYAYRDRVVRDWDALFARHRTSLLGARSPQAFADAAAALLGAAEDPHIHLAVGDRTIYLPTADVTRNYDVTGIRKTVPGFRYLNDYVAGGRFDDGTGYILIATWDGKHAEPIVAALDALLDELQQSPALIVDLRANGGGAEAVAARFAGRFVKQKKVYARHLFRDPESEDGWSAVEARVLEPAADPGSVFRGRLAVLQGPETMSSAEASVLMLRAVPNAVTVGEATRGASGNPRRYELGNGVAVYLPAWQALDAAGNPFEGQGIPPDVVVHVRKEDYAAGDPVIRRALEILREE